MKRGRPLDRTGERPNTSVYEDGGPLQRQVRAFVNHPPTPPESPERRERPSKSRKHGSKLMSVLRSMTNSGKSPVRKSLITSNSTDVYFVVSGASVAESRSLSPQPSTSAQGRRLSMVLLKGQLEPTVVHRTQFKSRPSVKSIDRGAIEIIQDPSPSISPQSSSNSGKSSIPRPGESTGKTSLDSKFSSNSKGVSQHSSENKKAISKQATGEGGSNENNLAPIAEVDCLETPEPVPSKVSCSTASRPISNRWQRWLLSKRQLQPRCSSNAIITASHPVN